MNTARHCLLLALLILSIAACDQRKGNVREGQGDHSVAAGGGVSQPADEIVAIPMTLDMAVEQVLAKLTEEDRSYIRSAGDEYEGMMPSHGGMGMRNGWGLWGDSSLSRYFLRLGIYHADDMSGIICKIVSRKVRGIPDRMDELVQYYRSYWAEQDIVSPLDLGCPHCKKEMRIEYAGEGSVKAHPERAYFSGHCPDGLVYYYYHKDGWLPESVVKGEQGAPDRPPPAP